MRFVSLYSSQLIAFAVVAGVAGLLLLSQRRLRRHDRDRVLGRVLLALAAALVGLAIYANATSPYIR